MATKNNIISFASANKRVTYNAADEHSENVIGKKIAEARNRCGLSLDGLRALLAQSGLSVGRAAINKWENGGSVPNAYQLIAVSHALGIERSLEYFTANAPRHELNEEGIKKLTEYKADLIATGRYKPALPRERSIRYIEKPVSYLPVSAGTGVFLDEGNFEMVSFPETAVPDGADFGLRISGDSMEPVYQDGQIVWVHQCETIMPGEVGIFIYDGEGFIKMYDEQLPTEDNADDFTDSYGTVHMQRVLISYNKEYEPRFILPQSEFQIVGRVL